MFSFALILVRTSVSLILRLRSYFDSAQYLRTLSFDSASFGSAQDNYYHKLINENQSGGELQNCFRLLVQLEKTNRPNNKQICPLALQIYNIYAETQNAGNQAFD